jgi:hypothetical protein
LPPQELEEELAGIDDSHGHSLRNLCSFLVFIRSADRLTPTARTAAEAPQAREAQAQQASDLIALVVLALMLANIVLLMVLSS